jgi:hypothetical protein
MTKRLKKGVEIKPFGPSCEVYTHETELSAETIQWLIESGRASKDQFEDFDDSSLTVTQIKARLGELTVAFDPKAKKPELLELLAMAEAEVEAAKTKEATETETN